MAFGILKSIDPTTLSVVIDVKGEVRSYDGSAVKNYFSKVMVGEECEYSVKKGTTNVLGYLNTPGKSKFTPASAPSLATIQKPLTYKPGAIDTPTVPGSTEGKPVNYDGSQNGMGKPAVPKISTFAEAEAAMEAKMNGGDVAAAVQKAAVQKKAEFVVAPSETAPSVAIEEYTPQMLLAMVNDSNSYWKAKTINDFQAIEGRRRGFALTKAAEIVGPGASLETIVKMADQIVEYCKTGRIAGPLPTAREVEDPALLAKS
jgi:hypothetical protein